MAIEENRENSGKECPDTQIQRKRNRGESFKQEVTRKSDKDRSTVVEVHRADKIA